MERLDYQCIKEIVAALKKKYKGIQSNSYGYCCNKDYDYHHTYINNNDYVCAKIFKGGLNNDYHSGEFILGDTVYWMWGLETFKLKDVIKTMREIADKYSYKVISPKDEGSCIKLCRTTKKG